MTTVRRAYGPLVTTGVALATAGVVVANPMIAPRGDVRIPAVELSAGSADSASMLDDSFLDAIAPAPADSTSPLSVLKDLFTSLAADATHIGKNAIVNAFIAGLGVVSDPELTASSPDTFTDPSEIAAIIPPADLPELVGILAMPEFDLGSVFPQFTNDGPLGLPTIQYDTPANPAPNVTLSVSTVGDFVTSLASSAGYLGKQAIAAAFATGALVAYEPVLIVDTLRSLVHGDFSGALEKAVKVVVAPLGPPAIVFDAVNSVIRAYLPEWNIPSVAPDLVNSLNGKPSAPDTSLPSTGSPLDGRSHSEVLASAAVRSAISPRAARSFPADDTESPTDGVTDGATDGASDAVIDGVPETETTQTETAAEAITATDAQAGAVAEPQTGTSEGIRSGARLGAARVAVSREAVAAPARNARAGAGQRSKAAAAAAGAETGAE